MGGRNQLRISHSDQSESVKWGSGRKYEEKWADSRKTSQVELWGYSYQYTMGMRQRKESRMPLRFLAWETGSWLPYPSLSPGVCSNTCPLSRWCLPTISSSLVPFSSCLQSFPASGSFSMSQLFASGGQNIGASASASVLPMNSQGWFPLGWAGLILQSKGLSRVLPCTTIWKHHSLGLSLLCGPSTHNYWKNHSFDYLDLCLQSDVSAF